MTYEIVDTPAIENTPNKKEHYPWATLPAGKSFVVKPGGPKYITLVSLAYKASKKYGRKFKVIDYGQHGMLVARLPDPLPTMPGLKVHDTPNVGNQEIKHWAALKDEAK